MIYRNKITGVKISVSSKLGGNWERIDAEPAKAPVITAPAPIVEEKIDKPKRKSTRKTKK